MKATIHYLLNMEQQYVSYKNDHRNPTNILLHVLCDPLLGVPYMAIFSLLPLPYPLTDGGRALAVFYIAYHVAMAGSVGACVTLFSIAYYMLAVTMRDGLGVVGLFLVTGLLDQATWAVLSRAHMKYEGNRPLLVRSRFQVYFAVPFFVWLDVWFYFGFFARTKQHLTQIFKEAKCIKAVE